MARLGGIANHKVGDAVTVQIEERYRVAGHRGVDWSQTRAFALPLPKSTTMAFVELLLSTDTTRSSFPSPFTPPAA
jgi:hypothetical protein